MMTEKDKALCKAIFQIVKENKLEILIMGKEVFIQDMINDLNSKVPGKTLKPEVESKLRMFYSSCIDSILGVECPA